MWGGGGGLGEFTTHVRTYFSWLAWLMFCGYDLDLTHGRLSSFTATSWGLVAVVAKSRRVWLLLLANPRTRNGHSSAGSMFRQRSQNVKPFYFQVPLGKQA